MTVSVIIVLWNAEPTLQSCLASLARSSCELQVLCVDNASEDRSASIAEEWGAEVLRAGRNLGFPAAVNIAIPRCRGDIVLLLNPDVVVEPDTIQRCAAQLEDRGVGLVGSNLHTEDGTPDRAAARRLRTLGLLAIESLGLQRLSSRLDRQYLPRSRRNVDQNVECINGAFMLLRRALLEQLGGLDEDVYLFLEDQDLCLRVRRRGLSTRFVSDAHALHIGGAATAAASPARRATIYLHRMDASIELVHRLQGPVRRRFAIALWALRCVIGLMARGPGSSAERLRYVAGLRWLWHQPPHRSPPPPVR